MVGPWGDPGRWPGPEAFYPGYVPWDLFYPSMVRKPEMEKISGVKFRIKDFRSTYAQMNLDRDPTLLPDVSKFLGHATTKTTEEHYGRIKDEPLSED